MSPTLRHDAGRPAAFDGRVSFPRFASIETTMYCNLECPFCTQFQNGTTVGGPHMELERFELVANALFPYVDRFQPSVSGEPLMSKRLGRMLAVAERYGVRVEYFTNGTLLNEQMQELILPTLGRVVVSFDGATPETFEAMRAGATFGKVVLNVKRIVAALKTIPEAERPSVGFACTLMEANVRELPQLVGLAHALGVDFLMAHHLLPTTDEWRTQSLAHYRELAAECIDEALVRAAELGLAMHVEPLDQLRVEMSDPTEHVTYHERRSARRDGVVDQLGARGLRSERIRHWPDVPFEAAEARAHQERRAALRGKRFRAEGRDAAPPPASIWTCDFLWDKVYVTHQGEVHTCCMPGNPLAGDLRKQSFEEIWDGPVYRTMRQALVEKAPVPLCRGCAHVREITDPAEIERHLEGRGVRPDPHRAWPPILRPIVAPSSLPWRGTREEPPAALEAPRLSWEAVDAEGYELQASTDGFDNVWFSTAWHDLRLTEPTFRIPDWGWEQIDPGTVVEWRALALLPRERRLVGGGFVRRGTG